MSETVALRRRDVVPAPVVAIFLLLFVDVMFFAAFLSSYYVIKRGRTDWIPAAIHLPVWPAGFSTFVLLLSGVFMIAADRNGRQLVRSLMLGILFLVFQVSIGVQMFHSGLTLDSGVFAGCYYMMIGAHVLNVLAGVCAIAWILRRIGSGEKIKKSAFVALQFFWLFVVAIWPVLYAEIYLYS